MCSEMTVILSSIHHHTETITVIEESYSNNQNPKQTQSIQQRKTYWKNQNPRNKKNFSGGVYAETMDESTSTIITSP